MPKPIAYKTGSIQPPNTVKQSNILVGIGPANWGVGVANTTFYNSLDSSYQYVIIRNTNPPAMWATGDFTDASLLTIINGLPDRVGSTPFTGATTAINWLLDSGTYSMLKNEQPYGGSLTSGLVLDFCPKVSNYFANGDFAYGTTIGWVAYGGTISIADITNDRPYVGSKSTKALQNVGGGFTWGRYTNPIYGPGGLLVVGNTYTFSFWAKVISGPNFDIGWNNQNGSGDVSSWTAGNYPVTTTWQKYTQTFTYNISKNFLYIAGSYAANTQYVITEMQLEDGTTANPFSSFPVTAAGLTIPNNGLLNTSSFSLVNGPYLNADANGNIGLDGVDDYVLLTDSTLKNYTTITANIWMYVSSTNIWETYFSYNAEEAGLSQGWGVRRQSNVDNYQYWGGTSNTGIKLYKNGVLVSSAVATHDTSYGTNKNNVWVMITLVAKSVSSWNTHNRLTIGTRSDSVNSATNMRVGSFNLYNKELTATEIANLYSSQLPIYQPTAVPVNSGLVLYLDASNPNSYPGSGATWNDLSGYGSNMTLLNSPTFNSDNGGYITFDNVDDFGYINVTSGNLLGNVNISMELWIKNPSGNFVMNGQYGAYFSSGFYSGGLLKNSGGSTGPSWSSTSTWQQWIAVWDQTLNQTRLYVNGTLTGVSSNTYWSPATGGKLVFGGGANVNGNYSKEGSMDIGIYRFYNKVLTQSEITQNYNATKTQFGLQ